jgi:hypothetical protein
MWPFGGWHIRGRESLFEVAVFVFVVDEEVKFLGTVRLLFCCGYTQDDFRVRLDVEWGYDTRPIYYKLLTC